MPQLRVGTVALPKIGRVGMVASGKGGACRLGLISFGRSTKRIMVNCGGVAQ